MEQIDLLRQRAVECLFPEVAAKITNQEKVSLYLGFQRIFKCKKCEERQRIKEWKDSFSSKDNKNEGFEIIF